MADFRTETLEQARTRPPRRTVEIEGQPAFDTKLLEGELH
jgi:hypothetical protein